MSDPVSLALLKGQNADAISEEPGVDGPIEQIEDIKKASVKALEALLADNDTTAPEGWADMTLTAKRGWVLAKFEAEAAAENKAAEIGDDATVDGAATSASSDPQVPKTDDPPFAPDSGKDAFKVMGDGEVVFTDDKKSMAAKAKKKDATADKVSSTPAEAAVAPAAEDKKPKGKKKDAGTSIAAIDVKQGEVMEPDILQDIVHEVENMPKEMALQLVTELSEQTDVAFFRLGGILSIVAANNWWKTGDDQYKTFRDYIEQAHGLEYRKATYWISIYNALAKSGVPWSKVKEVGWTKLKEIAKVLTPENVDTWVDKAKEVNTLTLHDMVKAEGDKEKTDSGQPGETEKVTTKTFKVHAGQKEVIEAAISKAKQVSGTEVDTVALENICQDYLSGSSEGALTPAQKLGKLVPGLSLEVVMHIVSETFADYDFVVDKKEDASAAA